MESEKKNVDIQKFLDSIPEKYSIIDQQIDVNTQVEYFELSQKINNKPNNQSITENIKKLYDETAPIDEIKIILIRLAAMIEVDAYRAIEKYYNTAEGELKDWTALALQESKVLLENSLLDEQKIIISTGLGGRDNFLRYFVVLLKNDDSTFEAHQQKIIKDEIEFAISQQSGDLETLEFDGGYCKGKILLPLKMPLKEFFKGIISECNQYGNFLRENFLLTNVKILDNKEIKDFIDKTKDK